MNEARPDQDDAYDDAMYEFSQGHYDGAIEKLRAILEVDSGHFDSQLSLGMAYYRQGDYSKAIEEGHRALSLKPDEPLVHTNLSLFYMKSGDLKTAEHHGLQAKISSWKGNMQPGDAESADAELKIATPKAAEFVTPPKFPDMPWKKNQKT